MRRSARITVLATALVAVPSLVRARAAMAHWGATRAEVARSVAGDGIVPDPDVSLTRAITIAAPPERVFPWLAQLGQGRAGFYSYDWLENRLGLDINSADHLLAGQQELAPGDRIAVAPGPPFYGFTVADVAPPSRLVLQMRIHPFTGLPTHEEPAQHAWSMHATWAFTLTPLSAASTRLVTRTRVALRMPVGLTQVYSAALQVAEFVMERRMLLGIRARAEGHPVAHTPVP